MEMEMVLEYLTLFLQLKGFLNLFEKRKIYINFGEQEFPFCKLPFIPMVLHKVFKL